MNKKGDLLVENIVFIVLNVAFLLILTLFLLKQGSGTILLEDAYSKEIALLIDSAKPGAIIKLNMEKGVELAEENGIDFSNVVSITGNYVSVKLTENGGDRYHFFKDFNVTAYPDRNENNEFNGIYVLTIASK